jgi:hypothetical protein
MKPLEHVHILIEPRDPGLLGDGRPNPSPREFYEYDRLAEELQRHTRARVDIVESWLNDAPCDGMLLIAFHIAMRESLLGTAKSVTSNKPRPVLLNMRYEDAFSLAEAATFSGVIMSDRLVFWKLRQDQRIYRQVYGLKSLAPLLAPLLDPAPLGAIENYCMYESREVLTLPFVLGSYINAYWHSLWQ